MKSIVSMSLMLLGLVLLLLFIFLATQTKKLKTTGFKLPFECGFSSKNKSTNSFSINYFYFTIIFLLFDLEIMFILPSVLYNTNSPEMTMLFLLVSFFLLLLVLEWMNNFLEWFKM